MDFFHSQESLTSIEWILRAIIAYLFLLAIAKLMGQRSISQLRFLDFVIALLIGNIIAHPLSDEGLGLKGSMLTMSVLVFLYLGSISLTLKSQRLRNFFAPNPLPLIEEGRIKYQNLVKARLTVDILLTELRKEKVEDISKVALALWEPGGAISVFLDTQYQPITPSVLNQTVKPFNFPATVIKERKIIKEELNRIGKTEEWIVNQLSVQYNVGTNEILLATITEREKLHVILYH